MLRKRDYRTMNGSLHISADGLEYINNNTESSGSLFAWVLLFMIAKALFCHHGSFKSICCCVFVLSCF